MLGEGSGQVNSMESLFEIGIAIKTEDGCDERELVMRKGRLELLAAPDVESSLAAVGLGVYG